MITCDDCRPMLHLLMDRELPPERTSEVESHMSSCPACSAYAKELGALDQALKNLPERIVPLTLQVNLRNIERRPVVPWGGDLARAAAFIALGGGVILLGEAFPGTVELLTKLGIAAGAYVLVFSRTFRPVTLKSG